MTDYQKRAADLFAFVGDADAEEVAHLFEQTSALIAEMEHVLAMLNADLTVARAEVESLVDQRNHTRVYLGVALDRADKEAQIGTPVDLLRNEVTRIIRTFSLDRKIQCIKELRCSDNAGRAWTALGNSPGQSLAGSVPLSLKDSKDIIDYAAKGTLYCGASGMYPL